jgi:hypothetical protein
MIGRWAMLFSMLAMFGASVALSACVASPADGRPSNPEGDSILDGPYDAPWFKDRPS